MTDETLDRLHQRLVEELRGRGAGETLTVGRLHREIVPYSAVRSTLGVALAADYEDALLRLLAGEKGLLRLEPAHTREELRRELDAPDPAPGLLRRLANTPVHITLPEPDERDETGGDPPDAPPAGPDDVAGVADEPAESEPGELEPGELEPGEPVRLHPAPTESGERRTLRLHDRSSAGAADVPDLCTACEAELPEDREVRFCPYCGHDQRVRRCGYCNAIMETEWRFCVHCGAEADGG